MTVVQVIFQVIFKVWVDSIKAQILLLILSQLVKGCYPL